MKVVPRPTSDSKRTVPPCFSTTMAWTRASPWPVPRPTSLVVKNMSKRGGGFPRGCPPRCPQRGSPHTARHGDVRTR